MVTIARTNEFKARLKRVIGDALEASGQSARQVSLAVVGHDGLIRDIKAGRLPAPDKLEALCEYLGLELYLGPRRPVQDHQANATQEDYALVPLHAASLAAGTGINNGSETVSEYLAFRRDWMRKIGVHPDNAALARVHGDSMQPTVWDGDIILIDTAHRDVPLRSDLADPRRRRSPIYAIVGDDGALIKRIERPSADQAVLLSDNPDYPPQFNSAASLSIIGKVVWWGHTNKD